jgi:hypothetical protein
MSTLKVNSIEPLTGVLKVSGSFSGSFEGDGSLLTNVDRPTGSFTGSFSGSMLVDDASGSFSGSFEGISSGSLSGSFEGVSSGSFSGSFEGDGSNLTGLPPAYSVANSLDNRIITSVDFTNGNAEENLTFDGSTLNITGGVSASAGFSGSFEGDGSNLTGVGGFPHTGSADITGSLIVTGSAFVTSLTETSALRYKKYVKNLKPQTDTVYQLRPVHFKWRDTNRNDFGLIAEEVEKVYPDLVTKGDDGNVLGISYTKLTSILIKTVQELTDRIEQLENKSQQ